MVSRATSVHIHNLPTNLHIDQCSKVSKQEKKPSGERIEGEADEIMKDEARDSLYTLATAPELHGKETYPTGEQHFSIEWRINHSDNEY